MNGGPAGTLAGMGILVTRPKAQANGLCHLIEQAGGRAFRFPAVDILPATEPTPAYELLRREWDLVLYVSANAVNFASALATGLPHARHNGAVGRATARTLASHGKRACLVPDQPDSEGLLALPELHAVQGRHVLIVRGEDGRSLLGDTLVERGAQVRYAEVYRRAVPDTDPAPLLASWRQDIHAVIVTSLGLLTNLRQMLGEQGLPLLADTPLLVISERMQHTAEHMGLQRIYRAMAADDTSLLTVLYNLALENGRKS